MQPAFKIFKEIYGRFPHSIPGAAVAVHTVSETSLYLFKYTVVRLRREVPLRAKVDRARIPLMQLSVWLIYSTLRRL